MEQQPGPGDKAQRQAAMNRALDVMLTKEMLGSLVMQDWDLMVGAWKDAEMELGETYVGESEEVVAVLDNATARMNFEGRVLRRLPCRRGGVERQCVEVSMLSTIHPDDVRRVVTALVSRVAGKDITAEVKDAKLTVTNRMSVITEPDGLIPHAYTHYQLVTFTTGLRDRSGDASQVKESNVRFSYD
jgi:hypothetical protein